MKLRIKGNSIRLRLTQDEVQRIAKGETVQEQVSFGSDVPAFTYALGVDPNATTLTAHYQEHTMRVHLPAAIAHPWAVTEQVSIEETVSWDEKQELYVLVEKDFQCLHRPNEEEPDNFPNPAATAE